MFIRSSTSEHLGFFSFWLIVYNAAMNIGICLFATLLLMLLDWYRGIMSHMVSLCLAFAMRTAALFPILVWFSHLSTGGLRIREGKGLTGGRDPWAQVLLITVTLTPLLERDLEIETHGSWIEPRCKLGSHLHRAGGKQKRENVRPKRAGSRSLGWGMSPRRKGASRESKGTAALQDSPSQALQSELTSCVTLGRLLTLAEPWSPCL